MDVAVAVVAAEIELDVVEILPVFPRDILVTAAAVHGGGFFLPLAVALLVRNPRVAARATVVAMDRFRELRAVTVVVVAGKAIQCGAPGRALRSAECPEECGGHREEQDRKNPAGQALSHAISSSRPSFLLPAWPPTRSCLRKGAGRCIPARRGSWPQGVCGSPGCPRESTAG